MKTLKLFNAVVKRESSETHFVDNNGFIIESGAIWAKDKIISYYEGERLSGNDLNKTFHKSWAKIQNSSRTELMVHQIMHYISTYGSNFTSEIYIPNEILEIPDVNLIYKVIKAYTVEELINKCLSMLKSGVALKEETINDIISVLADELNYTFTGKEGIKNKEAIIKIADMYNVLPYDISYFFRYVIYKATGESILIKNQRTILLIRKSNYNPVYHFKQFGLERLAEVFNRFKPLFLAFKGKCPATINKISKLSKRYHKPLASNILNSVTCEYITDDNKHWLDNATPFALFKALFACHSRVVNKQDTFVYNIRNGKSYTKENSVVDAVYYNYVVLNDYLKKHMDLRGKKIFLPSGIKYSIPTSEKMFVGNIPIGTTFYGDKLAIGVYWENNWGARDLDISSLNIGGKIGWNSEYKQNDELFYSGDITNAPNGAVEYIYAKLLTDPTLILNNVFSGDSKCGYKIIVGSGDEVDRNYMMDPNKLILAEKCVSPQTQTMLGIIIPENNTQKFVILNIGSGSLHVSGNNKNSIMATKALFQQWQNPIYFNDLISMCGAELVEDPKEADFDFSLNLLEKDTFIKFIYENYK